MTFKSLMAVVTALTLLIIAEAPASWSESEPKHINNQPNLQRNMKIVFEEGVLSVSLKEADLEEALKEISRQAEVKIEFTPPLKERVTVEFVDLPLKQGLRRLLKNQNYFFIFSKKKETVNKGAHYVLSRAVLLQKSTTGQKENDQLLAVTSEEISVNEISSDLINELLSQEPKKQEKALKTLSETIKGRLIQINPQLKEDLEEYGQKEDKDFGLEELEPFLSVNEISNDLINELLSQEPKKQEKALKTLSETIKGRLIQINPQLKEDLEEYGQKEDKDFGLEELEPFLRELDMGGSRRRSRGLI